MKLLNYLLDCIYKFICKLYMNINLLEINCKLKLCDNLKNKYENSTKNLRNFIFE